MARFSAGLLLLAMQPRAGSAIAPLYQIESEHFVVTSEDPDVGSLAQRLEQVHAVLVSVLPHLELPFAALAHAGSDRLEVLALEDSRILSELLPEASSEGLRVGAAFRPVPDGGELILSLVADRHSADSETASETGDAILFHELFHALTSDTLSSLPPCLREGMAEVLSTTTLSGSRVRVGGRHRRHSATLRRLDSVDLETRLDRVADSDSGTQALDSFDSYATCWALAHFVLFSQQADVLRDAIEIGKPPRIDDTIALSSYVERGHWPERVLALQKTPALEPPAASELETTGGHRLSSAERDTLLAKFYLRHRRPERARRLLASALESEPDLVAALETQGELELYESSYGAAVDAFARALEGAAEGGASYSLASRLVTALLEREKRSGLGSGSLTAIGLLERAIAHDSKLSPSWLQLAQIYATTDSDFDRVVAVCQAAVESEPESAWFRIFLARALARQGASAEARTQAQMASDLSVRQSSPVDANNVCWYGALGGFAEQVTAACEHAVALDPERGWFRDSRALAKALLGDYSGALSDLRYFLATDEADAPTRELRQRWVTALEEGQDPFDRATLEALDDFPF